MNKNVVLIGGCPRSGTTMLGSMLGVDESCITTPESHFKQQILLKNGVFTDKGISRDKLQSELKHSFRFKIWNIDLPEISAGEFLNYDEYRNYLFKLVDSYSDKHNKKKWSCWVDHTPQNFEQAYTLQKVFPEAKFIHIVRDPRAIYASVLKVDWGPVEAIKMAEWWALKLSYALAYSQFNPKRCKLIKYEDLVLNPEKCLIDLCDFTGISYRSDMINGAGFILPNYTNKQHKLVGNKPDPNRLNKWKGELTDQQINIIEKQVGDMMQLFDYKLTNTVPQKRNLLEKIKSRISKLLLKYRKKYRFNKRKRKLI